MAEKGLHCTVVKKKIDACTGYLAWAEANSQMSRTVRLCAARCLGFQEFYEQHAKALNYFDLRGLREHYGSDSR